MRVSVAAFCVLAVAVGACAREPSEGALDEATSVVAAFLQAQEDGDQQRLESLIDPSKTNDGSGDDGLGYIWSMITNGSVDLEYDDLEYEPLIQIESQWSVDVSGRYRIDQTSWVDFEDMTVFLTLIDGRWYVEALE